MKILITNYVFDASAQTITFTDYNPVVLDSVLVITNVTDNIIIYNFADTAKGGTVTGASAVLTLDYDTTGMADADDLMIYYDDTAQSNDTTEMASSLLSLSGSGSPTIDSYTTEDVNLAADGNNQVLVAAPGANKQIWVYGFMGTTNTDGHLNLQDEDDTPLTGSIQLVESGGLVMNPSGNFAMPWIKVATNKALEADTVTCSFDGSITYAIVSV